MPGPYEAHRLLAHELRTGALEGASGPIRASGRRKPVPALAPLIDAAAGRGLRPVPRAA